MDGLRYDQFALNPQMDTAHVLLTFSAGILGATMMPPYLCVLRNFLKDLWSAGHLPLFHRILLAYIRETLVRAIYRKKSTLS